MEPMDTNQSLNLESNDAGGSSETAPKIIFNEMETETVENVFKISAPMTNGPSSGSSSSANAVEIVSPSRVPAAISSVSVVTDISEPVLIAQGSSSSNTVTVRAGIGGAKALSGRTTFLKLIPVSGSSQPIQIGGQSTSNRVVVVSANNSNAEKNVHLIPPQRGFVATAAAQIDQQYMSPRYPPPGIQGSQLIAAVDDQQQHPQNPAAERIQTFNEYQQYNQQQQQQQGQFQADPSAVAYLNYGYPYRKKYQQQQQQQILNRGRKACNCTKSMCLKLYCECFANGEFCTSCNCVNCFNNLSHEQERSKAVKGCLERNPLAFHPKIGFRKGTGDTDRKHNKGCHCKKSSCLKNYCECYEAKVTCTNRCKCVSCRNTDSKRHTLARGVSNFPFLRFAYEPQRQLDNKVWNLLSEEVIEATTLCMLSRVEALESQGLSNEATERAVLSEFGRCIQSMIQHAA